MSDAIDELVDAQGRKSLASLTISELAELAALRRMRHVETFESFVGRVSGRFAIVPAHLQPLYDLIQRTRYEQVFATISEPPRHGKTTTFALAFAYRILYDPRCQNFYTTYADDRSSDVGLATMRIVEALGVPLDNRKHSAGDWGTTFGGGLRSTSKGGQITGGGANGGLIICDDLLKGFKEARSKQARDDIDGYIRADVMSRIEGGASFIVMNTRWHEDDPIGRIMADHMGLPFVHINMPAVHDGDFNPIDEREFPELATPLWTNVDSAHPGNIAAAMRWYALARLRGEHFWWSLYQGTPRGEKQKVFLEPSRYMLPCSREKPSDVQPFDWTGKRGAIILDPAATKKTSADFSAIGAIAMEGHEDRAVGYVVDAHKEQMTVPAATRMAYDWKQRYGLPLVVESVGAFAAIPQTLMEIEPKLEVLAPPMFGDKFTRAQPAAAGWNDGRFLIPTIVDVNGFPLRHADWIGDLIRLAKDFTGQEGDEDDLIDMIAHGWNHLQGIKDLVDQWSGVARAFARLGR